ncbi:MAG: chemotaxis protein CheX [Candidatus Loosdrechtia sp.]|uniref:chemotaxis protein CheX n=1 Tax=Candidatus Loosdrechtia sp. TaxID=3101272 RepID=UPI003A5F2FF8|nr:MAG: chemotaxis protein CheX [Candidatus Jettenia sp. AMX2]
MTITAYGDITEDVISCTNEIFATMIPMNITHDGSFYQKEDMITTDVISLVSFTGEHSGIIAVFCSKEIALKITTCMLGIEVSEMNQDAKDAMGEVTNMIAGSLKNRIYERFGAMHLSVPIVIAGADLSISSASNKEHHHIKISPGITCNSQNSWLMTPFSSDGNNFSVGIIIKKND